MTQEDTVAILKEIDICLQELKKIELLATASHKKTLRETAIIRTKVRQIQEKINRGV